MIPIKFTITINHILFISIFLIVILAIASAMGWNGLIKILPTIITLLAYIGGVSFAYHLWQVKKKTEIAEELYIVFSDFIDILWHVRHPMSSSSEGDNVKEVVVNRFKRNESDFRSVRAAIKKAEIYFPLLADDLKVLIEARRKIIYSANRLLECYDERKELLMDFKNPPVGWWGDEYEQAIKDDVLLEKEEEKKEEKRKEINDKLEKLKEEIDREELNIWQIKEKDNALTKEINSAYSNVEKTTLKYIQDKIKVKNG